MMACARRGWLDAGGWRQGHQHCGCIIWITVQRLALFGSITTASASTYGRGVRAKLRCDWAVGIFRCWRPCPVRPKGPSKMVLRLLAAFGFPNRPTGRTLQPSGDWTVLLIGSAVP